MSMDSDIRAIHEFPEPRNKKELQSFVGFCNFYHKFADHHATLIGPLINLIIKDTPWRFGGEKRKSLIVRKYHLQINIYLIHRLKKSFGCKPTPVSWG